MVTVNVKMHTAILTLYDKAFEQETLLSHEVIETCNFTIPQMA